MGAALLVWWLTLLTLSTPVMKTDKMGRHANIIALFAALVFVSHPLQTEAVTYIIQRAASLATLFYLLSLCLYVKARLVEDSGRNTACWTLFYTGSLVAAVLGMFTKETAITLPLMIALYEFSFLTVGKSFKWKRLIPFFLILLLIPLVMFLTETSAARLRELRDEPGISPVNYCLTQFRVMLTYIRLVFIPAHQNLDYDYPVYKNILAWPVLASLAFLSSAVFLARRLFVKYRLVSFAIFWFFLTLLPESSILPIKDVIYEHRLYLPLVGYSLLLVSGIYYLLGNNVSKVMVLVLMGVIGCNSVLTYQRNNVWKDELALWKDAVEKSPRKARPYNNYGFAYDKRGDFSEAIVNYSKAIELDPAYADAYNNRGLMYYKQGRLDRAILDYDRAIGQGTKLAGAYINRGVLFEKQGNLVRALSDYNTAIDVEPGEAGAFLNRANVYVKQNDLTLALKDYNNALKIYPDFADAYYDRGILYDKQGDLSSAILDLTKVIELNPDHARAYLARGLIFLKQGDTAQAMSEYSKAIVIDPQYAEAFNNRAVGYYTLKDYDQAWRDVRRAEGLGFSVHPGFLSALEQASGRVK